MFFKGSLVTKPQEVANSQNEYFIEKVFNIRSNLPQSPIDPLGRLRNLMSKHQNNFKLHVVHPDQVEEVIRGLKNSNSSGLDNISTSIVKKMGLELLPAITHIVNLSIMTNKFPTMWKRAKIIPLLKSGDRLDPITTGQWTQDTSLKFAYLILL